MQIYGNENLLNYKKSSEDMQEKFVVEVDALNNVYFPIFSHQKITVKNRVYIMGLTVCLLVFSIFLVLFGPARNYQKLVNYIIGFSLLLVLSSLVWAIISIIKFKSIKSEWQEKHTSLLKYKQDAGLYLDKAKAEVAKVITLTIHHDELESYKKDHNEKGYNQYFDKLLQNTQNNIILELGNKASSEDYLLYYEKWGRELTQPKKDDYDYLEARRRKAILATTPKKE